MRRFAFALLLSLSLFAVTPFLNSSQAGETDAVVSKAPSFTLRDLDNKEVKLEDFAGKVTLLSFWATWCSPCLVELTHVDKMYQTYKDQGFQVLAISADDARSTGRVKPLVMSKKWTFPVLLDPQTRVVALYNPGKTLPYSELLNDKHQVIWRHQGYTPGDEVELEKKVLEALALRNGAAPVAPTQPVAPQ